MKKSLLYLLSGICLTMVSTNAFAISEQIDIRLTVFQNIEEESEHPSKGYRSPTAPVICTIDFKNYRITTSIPDEIIAYELWEEEGETQLVSYATDYEIVEYMNAASGVFQLRLLTSERTYIGYIDL